MRRASQSSVYRTEGGKATVCNEAAADAQSLLRGPGAANTAEQMLFSEHFQREGFAQEIESKQDMRDGRQSVELYWTRGLN